MSLIALLIPTIPDGNAGAGYVARIVSQFNATFAVKSLLR